MSGDDSWPGDSFRMVKGPDNGRFCAKWFTLSNNINTILGFSRFQVAELVNFYRIYLRLPPGISHRNHTRSQQTYSGGKWFCLDNEFGTAVRRFAAEWLVIPKRDIIRRSPIASRALSRRRVTTPQSPQRDGRRNDIYLNALEEIRPPR